jgi:hypothetical protein
LIVERKIDSRAQDLLRSGGWCGRWDFECGIDLGAVEELIVFEHVSLPASVAETSVFKVHGSSFFTIDPCGQIRGL